MEFKPFDKEASLSLAARYIKAGHALQISGEIAKAIIYYNKSIESYPTPEAYTYLGWAYSQQKKYNKAIDACLCAIDFDPSYGNPYNDIGAYLIELKKLDEAEEYLKEALYNKNYTTPQFAYFNLGVISQRRGDWFEAKDYFKKSLDLDPTNKQANEAYYNIISMLN